MLMPYFGKWPVWFPLYLESCRWNPTIEWLFFTDCPVPANPPDNVSFVEMSMEELGKLAARKLELPELQVSTPYKLCDLRPMFGIIFEDYLKEADYWGHGDTDVIYGSLRDTFTEELLRYKIISMHRRYISGHLTLFRNSDEVNNLFRKMEDWEALVQHPRNLRVDEDRLLPVLGIDYFSADRIKREWDGPPVGTDKGYYFHEAWSTPRFYLNKLFSLRRIRWRGLPQNKLWRGQERIPDVWYWKAGRLWNNIDPDDRPYFHFMHWAREDWKCIPKILSSPVPDMLSEGFRMEKTGCYAMAASGAGWIDNVRHTLLHGLLRLKIRWKSLLTKWSSKEKTRK